MTNQQRKKTIPQKIIESRLARLVGPSSSEGLVEITFIDDVTIAEVAGRYRGSHKPTDVLAFGYDSDDGGLAGEILISVETAYKQAKERRVKFVDELTLLCLHGLLHLSGIDDEIVAGWCEMRRAEFEGMITVL